MPRGFTPAAVDGEVAAFELLAVDDLAARLAADDASWKPNSATALVDFLVRRGVVSSDEADYVPLVASLRRRVPPGCEL